MISHTPAPWKWIKRQTRGSKTWELIHPANGYLVVMDFCRLGMSEGTFRLAEWEGDERANMGGIMAKAHELDIENHPDARLIAAAPRLLEACMLFQMRAERGEFKHHPILCAMIEAAIKNATGAKL